MAENVNVGGAKLPRKGVEVFAVLAVALVGYGLYKSHKTQQAASSSPSSSTSSSTSGAYPPDGTTGNPSDPYSTDPATGMTYGDESGAGYAGAVAVGGYGYGGYGGGSPYGFNTGGFGPLPGTPGGSGPSPGNFTSNAQWAQYAEQFMGSNGNDSTSAAIGKYITGQPVTSDQQTTIEQAIAIAGYPPVAGPDGYPPSMHVTNSGPPPSTVPVPAVVGKTAGAAHNAIGAAGLVPRDPNGAVPGEFNWKVIGTSPSAGTQVAKGSDVTIFAQR